MLRRSAFALCAFALVCLPAASALAQKGGVPKGTAVTLKGKVSQVVPQGLLVEGSDGKKYGVGFTGASKVSMTGTAGSDYLSNGMFVQLEVELDAQGKPTKEVQKLSIIEQSTINQPGISSSEGPDAKQGTGGLFLVRGTVRGNKNGELTVAAGSKPLTVKLSGAVSIPVTTSDWRMAQPGDEITGDAQSFPAQQGAPFTPAMAEAVTIKAVMPFQKKKGR
ncbi:MAG: hypothetical protein QM775_20965 [Pirellulales bacterium]